MESQDCRDALLLVYSHHNVPPFLSLSLFLSLSTLGLLCLVVTASSLCPASLPIVSFRASLFSDSFSVMRPSQNDGVVWLVGCSRVMYNK